MASMQQVASEGARVLSQWGAKLEAGNCGEDESEAYRYWLDELLVAYDDARYTGAVDAWVAAGRPVPLDSEAR